MFFFSSSHRPKDLSLFWITFFILPNDDLISLTTVTALSGESESGKGGGEESEERRQAGRPQRIRIAKSNQQIIIFCCSFPILRGVPLWWVCVVSAKNVVVVLLYLKANNASSDIYMLVLNFYDGVIIIILWNYFLLVHALVERIVVTSALGKPPIVLV